MNIPDTHAEAWTLLPWLVNGRISDEDREWVAPHVAGCEDCRREVDAQRAIAAQMREEPQAQTLNVERSFGKLWTRIEAAEGAVPVSEVAGAPMRRQPSRTVRWLAAAVVVQAVGLATLGLAAWNGGKDGYQTVTDPAVVPGGSAAIRLVFAPETSVAAMNETLDRYDLKIVSGPGLGGQFTAAVTGSAKPDVVATMLSSNPHVQFAQPVAKD
jgi:hypothetical protein